MPENKKRPETQDCANSQTGGSVKLPEPTSDQREYVSDLIEWRDKSYTPNSVIGGPNGRGVD